MSNDDHHYRSFDEMTRRYDPFADESDQKRLNERDLQLASLFKALSSPVRLKILRLVDIHQCYCGDLVELLDMAQSTVSHHLKILRDAGLIEARQEGTSTCYCLNRDRLRQLQRWFSTW